MALKKFSDGFSVGIAKVNTELVVNGVPVTFPNGFSSDWLLVHGLHRAIGEAPETPEQGGKSWAEMVL